MLPSLTSIGVTCSDVLGLAWPEASGRAGLSSQLSLGLGHGFWGITWLYCESVIASILGIGEGSTAVLCWGRGYLPVGAIFSFSLPHSFHRLAETNCMPTCFWSSFSLKLIYDTWLSTMMILHMPSKTNLGISCLLWALTKSPFVKAWFLLLH